MITTIPFSGFYGSMHDEEIDRALESMLSNSSGCHAASERISEEIWSHVNTPMAEYTRAFVECFESMFNGETGLKVSLKWESIESPHEYNFATDRVFATVSFADVQAMFNRVDKAILTRICRESFTSCSGFISHYNNDWKTWGSLREWDHNQIGTIIAALVDQFFDESWEWNAIEDWSSNGMVDDWVYSNLDDEGKRLVKIADYLRQREERKYRSHFAAYHVAFGQHNSDR